MYVHCDMRICDVSDPNSKCTVGCSPRDHSPQVHDVIPPFSRRLTSRGDVPESVARPDVGHPYIHRPIRGRGDVPETRWRRDVSQAGSSSGAYPSTGGQLRFTNDQGNEGALSHNWLWNLTFPHIQIFIRSYKSNKFEETPCLGH